MEALLVIIGAVAATIPQIVQHHFAKKREEEQWKRTQEADRLRREEERKHELSERLRTLYSTAICKLGAGISLRKMRSHTDAPISEEEIAIFNQARECIAELLTLSSPSNDAEANDPGAFELDDMTEFVYGWNDEYIGDLPKTIIRIMHGDPRIQTPVFPIAARSN